MAAPLTTARNNFNKNPKNSTIYTPVAVAQFLFDTLHAPLRRKFDARHILRVFDPAIGSGRLTDPWYRKGCHVIGCDIHANGNTLKRHELYTGRFEDITWNGRHSPDLVLCNPPFNGCTGRQLYPAVFLEHIFKLFGSQIPTVMFVPMGFRLNQRKKSKRFRCVRDCGAEIASIITLPLDIFESVEFHSEVLVFNVQGLKPHYWLPEEALL